MENMYKDDEVFNDALEEIQLTEHTLISLYALDRVLSPKVVEQVVGRKMLILVDSRSTRNFVQSDMLAKGNLQVSHIPEF